jgi:hypothetical protein
MSEIDERIVTERAIGKVIALRQSHAELLQAVRDIMPYWQSHEQDSCGVHCAVCRAREAVRKAERLSS